MPRPDRRLPRAPSRAALRGFAAIEAVTWVGLLAGMLVKYTGSGDETGVHVFGPLHGGAFLLYLTAVVAVRFAFGWSTRLTLVALVCSVPPFASLVFELWAERSGRLDVGDGSGPAARALESSADQRPQVHAE